MKKLFYLPALAAMIFSSCSSDELGVESDVAETDQTFYMQVAIRDAHSGSKADNKSDNFRDGEGYENAIHEMYFKFYNAAGEEIYQTPVITNVTTDSNAGNSTYPNVGQIATATVKVEVTQGENMPAYVVCFANPVAFDDVSSGKAAITDLNGLRNKKRSAYMCNNGNFAMNNSVYYGTSKISGASGVKIVGAPIQKGQLFTSEEEANKATGKNVVEIFIERYAAKVNFAIAAGAVKTCNEGDYTLTFVPEAWGITADAPDMYAIKRFSTTDGDDAPVPSQSDIDNMLGTWTSWNDEQNRRSYWTCSPGYYGTTFPSVSDDISDVTDHPTENGCQLGAGVSKDQNPNYPFLLKYYSYNQLTTNPPTGTIGQTGYKPGIGTPILAFDAATTWKSAARYALENTMGENAFNPEINRNPKAAAPSAVIVRKYKVTHNGTDLDANTTFYIYSGSLFFAQTNTPAGETSLYNKMLSTQNVIGYNNGTDIVPLHASADIPAGVTFEIAHPSKAIRDLTDVKLSEELVTLQLTAPGNNVIYYKPQNSSKWQPITNDNKDAALSYVNRQLAGQLRYAHAYTNGMAYFTIPIRHLGYYENTAGFPTTDGTEGGKIDWKRVTAGDFGLVRNHVYDLNIKSISGLASGILNPDAPIVTPMESNAYWIRYTLNILNWRIVNQQDIEL